MKVTAVTLNKNFKVGLPMYSSMDVGITLTFEVKDGEVVDWSKAWDEINQQLQLQTSSVDPSWITLDKTTNEWKYTIRIPKNKL